MGGYGSGRRGTGNPYAMRTVGSCLALDVGLLMRAGVIRPGASCVTGWA